MTIIKDFLLVWRQPTDSLGLILQHTSKIHKNSYYFQIIKFQFLSTFFTFVFVWKNIWTFLQIATNQTIHFACQRQVALFEVQSKVFNALKNCLHFVKVGQIHNCRRQFTNKWYGVIIINFYPLHNAVVVRMVGCRGAVNPIPGHCRITRVIIKRPAPASEEIWTGACVQPRPHHAMHNLSFRSLVMDNGSCIALQMKPRHGSHGTEQVKPNKHVRPHDRQSDSSNSPCNWSSFVDSSALGLDRLTSSTN